MKVLHPSFASLVGAVVISALVASNRLAAQEPAAAAEKPKAKQGSELLREIRRQRKPLLAALASKYGYRVEAGAALRRVAPPFPDERIEYYRVGHPGQADAMPNGPSAMIFRQLRGGGLKNKSMTFSGGSGHSVESLIAGLTGIKSQMIEGGDVRDARVQGDWVFRDGDEPEEIVEQLAAILRNEQSLDVDMEFREIQRPVYVVDGTYKFTPLPGGRQQSKTILADRTVFADPIEIFGKQLVPNSGAGGGSGQFEDLLVWLGDWIGEPIVSDLEVPPEGQFSWQLHRRSPATDQTRAEDHDPKLVLPNITTQTGLTFTLEQRPFKTLFVDGTR